MKIRIIARRFFLKMFLTEVVVFEIKFTKPLRTYKWRG